MLPKNVDSVVKACGVLHNYLTEPGKDLHEIHRRMNPDQDPYLQDNRAILDIDHFGFANSANARAMRNLYTTYYTRPKGSFAWQQNRICYHTMWIISEQPAANITQQLMNIQCGLILDNLETELNCCKTNVQCRLLFKGNKPTSELSKPQSVFHCLSIHWHPPHWGWNWGHCRGHCRHTIPHSPHPQVVAWGN